MPDNNLTDGRDSAERHCTRLACAVEHCLQQHKYILTPACQQKLDSYNTCVKETRAALAAKKADSNGRSD